MNYYITDTESEAEAQEADDFAELKESSLNASSKYWEVTCCWDKPKQRLDGKWVRAVCPASTSAGRTIEAYQESWFDQN